MKKQENTPKQPVDNIAQNCPKCKSLLPDSACFCPACGKKLTVSKRKYHKRAAGTGSIKKLSGHRTKPWLATKNDICIGTYKTRTEAEQALSRAIDTKVTDQYNITFEEVYRRWKTTHDATIADKSAVNYETAYKHCPSLYQRKMRDIMHSDYQMILDDLAEKEYSLSACSKVRNLFSQIARYAANERITQYNAADGLVVTAKQKSIREIFTPEDIKLLQDSDDPAAGIVLIMISCGCRPGELFSVPLSNCASDHFIWGSKTAKGKNRVIPIGQEGIAQYQTMQLMASIKGGTKLIDGYTGRNHTENNWCKREFQDLMKALNIEGKVPYSARHTFITRSIQGGMPLHVLEDIVGHVDAETTKIYTHLRAADFVQAVNDSSSANLSKQKPKTRKAV